MIKYIFYRGYMLKNLSVGVVVEIHKRAHSAAESTHISTSESEVMAMFWVDGEITRGGEGMATQSGVDELNRSIQPAPAYPDNIMQKVRQHIGLESYDTSRDAEINSMSHDSVFQHCLEWEGIIGYDLAISYWIRDIYGVSLG